MSSLITLKDDEIESLLTPCLNRLDINNNLDVKKLEKCSPKRKVTEKYSDFVNVNYHRKKLFVNKLIESQFVQRDEFREYFPLKQVLNTV